ncbi:hypothetical protein [Xenorhabdus sp. KJ12.1]|uniref:hypothetical protein n=1 Tax=Xenorhabdus sp. KJ12.1 TaxID=1851571 RepID=UPI000C04005C|nr:hypothetical protein [Xenorhabdus sp. KJ12.1]PHM67975.1 hypothetical protein Xekj_03698 [Xenorhabdus sp. KJ12.1]
MEHVLPVLELYTLLYTTLTGAVLWPIFVIFGLFFFYLTFKAEKTSKKIIFILLSMSFILPRFLVLYDPDYFIFKGFNLDVHVKHGEII